MALNLAPQTFTTHPRKMATLRTGEPPFVLSELGALFAPIHLAHANVRGVALLGHFFAS